MNKKRKSPDDDCVDLTAAVPTQDWSKRLAATKSRKTTSSSIAAEYDSRKVVNLIDTNSQSMDEVRNLSDEDGMSQEKSRGVAVSASAVQASSSSSSSSEQNKPNESQPEPPVIVEPSQEAAVDELWDESLLLDTSDEEEEVQVHNKFESQFDKYGNPVKKNQFEALYDKFGNPIANEEADAELAKALDAASRKEKEEEAKRRERELADAKRAEDIAANIRRQQKKERRARIAHDLEQMRSTAKGRAVLFVKNVLTLILPDGVKPVARDDMTMFAEKFFEAHERFGKNGYPTHVGFGYHRTKKGSFQSIQQTGLLNREELKQKQAKVASFAGMVYGPGIYVSNNPTAFQAYGPICMLCVILRGREIPVAAGSNGSLSQGNWLPNCDCVLGNKTLSGPPPRNHIYNEIVLRASDQIIPVIAIEDNSKASDPKFVRGLERAVENLVKGHFNQEDTMAQFPNTTKQAGPVRSWNPFSGLFGGSSRSTCMCGNCH